MSSTDTSADSVGVSPAGADRARLIDRLCDDFESAWRQGDTPVLDEYLQRVPDELRTLAFGELLQLDVGYRNDRGLPASPEEYDRQFPRYQREIRDAFVRRDSKGLSTETQSSNRSPRESPLAAGVPGYELLGEIGRGGMGVVYKARHAGLNRLVALKMIRGGENDGEALARFRVEAEAVARLNHPGIVQVYEVGSVNGHPYLALEFVGGGSLSKAIAGEPQPLRLAAATVARLADAVHAAHAAGILHRDLKPGNVLLGERPASERAGGEPLPWSPKITDFGLAKQIDDDSGQTQTGVVLGTPSYMAPEQAAGRRDLDGTADVYALGGILYELLTGRPPFRAATPYDTIGLVLNDDPVAPSRLRPKLPSDLETICLKCLRKDPKDRYPSAEALADDLRRFLDGEPVLARPVPAWERLLKWSRRRPALAGLIAATIVALVALVGGGVALSYSTKLEGALDLAERRRNDADTQRNLADQRKTAAEASAEEARTQRGEAERQKIEAERQKAEAERQRANAEKSAREAENERAEAIRQRERAERFQYFAQMQMAHRALDDKDVPRLLEVLDRYIPRNAGDPDLRGFEWHYIRRLSRNLHAMRGHSEDVNDVAFSPDGRYVATASWDNTVKVWDVLKGKMFRTLTLTQRDRRVGAVAYNHDGTRMAASFGSTITVFDVNGPRAIANLAAHEHAVGTLDFSRDGQRLASGDVEGTIIVWNAETKTPLMKLPGEKGEAVRGLVFHPLGLTLVAAVGVMDHTKNKTVGGCVRSWSLETEKELWKHDLGMEGASDLAIDPEGQRVAVAVRDGTIRVLDYPTGDESLKFDAHRRGATSVRFSPDGRRLASTGYDLMVRVWNSADGKEELTLPGHTGRGTRIKSRGEAGVNRVAFSADGRKLASVGDDRAVMLWDVAPPLNPFPPEYEDKTNQVHSPDGRVYASWERPVVKVRDSITHEVIHTLQGESELGKNMWFDDSSRQVVVEYGRPTRDLVQVYDLATGKSLVKARPTPEEKLRLGRDSRVLVATTTRARMWDLATAKESETQGGHASKIGVVSVSPDGTRMATAASVLGIEGRVWNLADGEVLIWEVATGRKISALSGHTWVVRSIDWSADSKQVATGSQDGTIRLWDVETGKQNQFFRGHKTSVFSVDLSPDGQRVASAGEDQMVRLWDVMTGEEVLTLKGHDDAVWEVQFGPEGDYLWSRQGLSTRRVWDARPADR